MGFFQDRARSVLEQYIQVLKELNTKTDDEIGDLKVSFQDVARTAPDDLLNLQQLQNRKGKKRTAAFILAEVGILKEHGALIGATWYDNYIPEYFRKKEPSPQDKAEKLAKGVTGIFTQSGPKAPGEADKVQMQMIFNALMSPYESKYAKKQGAWQRRARDALETAVMEYTIKLNDYLESGDMALDRQKSLRREAVRYFMEDVQSAVDRCVELRLLNPENISTTEDFVENSIIALMSTLPVYAAEKTGVLTVNSLIGACTSLLSVVDSGSMTTIATSIFVLGFTIVAFVGLLVVLTSSTAKTVAHSGRRFLAKENSLVWHRDISAFDDIKKRLGNQLDDVMTAAGKFVFRQNSNQTAENQRRKVVERQMPNLSGNEDFWVPYQSNQAMLGSILKTVYDTVQIAAYSFMSFMMINDMLGNPVGSFFGFGDEIGRLADAQKRGGRSKDKKQPGRIGYGGSGCGGCGEEAPEDCGCGVASGVDSGGYTF